jgi:hypothetical protein
MAATQIPRNSYLPFNFDSFLPPIGHRHGNARFHFGKNNTSTRNSSERHDHITERANVTIATARKICAQIVLSSMPMMQKYDCRSVIRKCQTAKSKASCKCRIDLSPCHRNNPLRSFCSGSLLSPIAEEFWGREFFVTPRTRRNFGAATIVGVASFSSSERLQIML